MFKMLRTNKGFTLVEVMIAAAILGVISLALMGLMKMQTGSQIDAKNVSDLSAMKNEIQSVLTTPQHCNANFYGKASGTDVPVTYIYKCNVSNAGACRTASNSSVWLTANSTSWPTTNPTRIRINNIKMTVNAISTTTAALTTASLTVQYDIKTSGKVGTSPIIKSETTTYSVPVIYNGTTVTGCPKSWNSTVPY